MQKEGISKPLITFILNKLFHSENLYLLFRPYKNLTPVFVKKTIVV